MTNNIKQMIIKAPDGQVINIEHLIKTNEVIFVDEKPSKIEFPKEWSLQEKKYYYISGDSEIDYFKSDGSISQDLLKSNLTIYLLNFLI